MDGETAEEVIAAAHGTGETISRQQLVRWHRAGLIERPRVRHLGRGRGTVTLYPVGTADRAVVVARLLRHRRRLGDVGWLLWWDGAAVDEAVVRRHLDRVVATWQEGWALLYRPDGSLTEAAEDALDIAGDARLRDRVLSHARRRVGTDLFPDFLAALLQVVSGDGRLLDDEVPLLERGLGVDGATADDRRFAGWYDGGLQETLAGVGRTLAPETLAESARRPLGDLARARDEVRQFIVVVEALAAVASGLGGRRRLAGAALRTITDGLTDEPTGQALLLSAWLAMRDAGLGNNIDELVSVAPRAGEALEAFAAIEAVRERIPAARPLLSTRRLDRMLIDPDSETAVLDDIRRLRRCHGRDIDRILDELVRNGAITLD